MTSDLVYHVAGAGLLAIALWRLATCRDTLRRITALNVLAIGIAMVLLASGHDPATGVTNPVPQAFVLTGIVVLVAVTAALLALAERLEGSSDE
ncbi:NADH-ubiquinone oxidoreductase subunit 4L [Roseivivax halodurans JCM 10272]|uniref:NADH-ubiquinone oxidoreductase subunit 4L n=1 Tax=Roseivivax halodurans JCM 10272 TaxID=1449350 RepID=X7EE86_9RHOB|nr:NADH-quinone oxidoreductase subunit K [Roseivivax halodurans]ETX14257.1 NADH-ubiquinone oxidoreductase subunit 4L [Roseivivax halodurans JCM 10272]